MKKSFTCLLLALLLGTPSGAQGFLKGKILYFDAGANLSPAGRRGTVRVRSPGPAEYHETGFPGIHGEQGGADPALLLRFPGRGLLRALRNLRQVPARFRPTVPRTGAHDVHLDGGCTPDDILIQVCGSFSADFVYICKLLKY